MALNLTEQKLVLQAQREIAFARRYKQQKVSNWQKTEDMYYGRKQKSDDAMANVELGKMASFVDTVLSKIDSPLTFEYQKQAHVDSKKAKLANALKDREANKDDWNFKDIMGKKQAIMYGRAIYSCYAESTDGYVSHLENVDVYDFLIDPNAGGYDIEKAYYLGRAGIIKTRQQLKDGDYISSEVKKVLNGGGDNPVINQEELNKQNRYSELGSITTRVLTNPDQFYFFEWFTTDEKGERWYLLMQENGACIRMEKLKDMFKDGKYPFWTWAIYADLTEFWTPSMCDYVREIFMAQSVSINQMLDNAQKRNKPQIAYDPEALVNESDLKYRPNGKIRLRPGRKPSEAYSIIETAAISTPIDVYNILDGIQQTESGVTSAAKGVAEEDKVTIYEGNLAQAADRFGLKNKSYAQGYKRFAELFWDGAMWHLTKKTSVKILGPDGLEKTVFVGKRDIRPKNDFNVLIKSSNAEAQSDAVDKKNKLTFLSTYRGDQTINQKKLFEITAEISGFGSDEIRALQDTSDYGESDLMAEADRDILDLLNKKIIEPNMRANNAYRKRIVDYMADHMEDMTTDQWLLFTDYVNNLEPVVVGNMTDMLNNILAKEGKRASTQAISEVEPLVQGQTPEQLEEVTEPTAQ